MLATDLADLETISEALDRWLREAARARRLRALDRIERSLERTMARFFRYQAKVVRVELAADRARRMRQPREAVEEPPLNWEDPWTQARRLTSTGMMLALEGALQDAIDQGILAANIELTAEFALGNPTVVNWLAQHAAESVTGINATTEQAIRDLVTDGVAAGDSYGTIARSIVDQIAGYAQANPAADVRSRAHTIAITEMGNGYVQGTVMVAQSLADAGVEMEKAWLAADDPCDDCGGNEAAGWIPFDDTFPSGDDEPLAHPNCHCDLLTRAAGTSSALDNAEGD